MVPAPKYFLFLGAATCYSLPGHACQGNDCNLIDDITAFDSANSFVQVARKAIQSQKTAAPPEESVIAIEESASSEEKAAGEAAWWGDILSMKEAAPSAEQAPKLSDIPKFVISTGKYGKRAVPFAHEVQKFGDAFQNVCRVQAVVGSQCSAFWHGRLDIGSASVSTSHMKIWQHMVENQIPVAIIMEDDAFGMVAPNFIPLLQKALDGYKIYDKFRFSRIPIPPTEQLQHDVDPVFLLDKGGTLNCRNFYGEQLAIMTLSGAKFSLENFQFGLSTYSLDVYHKVQNNATMYSNIDSFKIACFDRGVMRFMDDSFGDASDAEGWDEARQNSEKVHPEHIADNLTVSLEDQRLIKEEVPDCPSGGILMEPCANYMSTCSEVDAWLHKCNYSKSWNTSERLVL